MSYLLTSVELRSAPQEICPVWDAEGIESGQSDGYNSSDSNPTAPEETREGDVDDLTETMKNMGLPSQFLGRTNSGEPRGCASRSNGSSNKPGKDEWSGDEWVSGFDGQTNRSYLFNTQNGMACWLPPNGLNTMSLKLVKVDQMNKKDEKIVRKWWWRRFKLFSRYDWGIALDGESWYRYNESKYHKPCSERDKLPLKSLPACLIFPSVTPERVANHHAQRIAAAVEAQGRRAESTLVIDAFAGCGGNVIAFAKRGFQVIGVEMDAKRAAMCRHNCAVYGPQVFSRVEIIQGDVIRLASSGRLRPDVVFLSPPWGGPSYKSAGQSTKTSPTSTCYNLDQICPPYGMACTVDAMISLTPKLLVFFLPRTTSTSEVGELIESRLKAAFPSMKTSLEMEYTYLDSWLVALSIYCGASFECTASRPIKAPPILKSKARMHFSSGKSSTDAGHNRNS